MRKLAVFLALATAIAVLPACDIYGGGTPTIGGTYNGTWATGDVMTMVIPANTESDPNGFFDLRLIFPVFPDREGIREGTYIFPTLTITSIQVTCAVEDDGDALFCDDEGTTGRFVRQ